MSVATFGPGGRYIDKKPALDVKLAMTTSTVFQGETIRFKLRVSVDSFVFIFYRADADGESWIRDSKDGVAVTAGDWIDWSPPSDLMEITSPYGEERILVCAATSKSATSGVPSVGYLEVHKDERGIASFVKRDLEARLGHELGDGGFGWATVAFTSAAKPPKKKTGVLVPPGGGEILMRSSVIAYDATRGPFARYRGMGSPVYTDILAKDGSLIGTVHEPSTGAFRMENVNDFDAYMEMDGIKYDLNDGAVTFRAAK